MGLLCQHMTLNSGTVGPVNDNRSDRERKSRGLIIIKTTINMEPMTVKEELFINEEEIIEVDEADDLGMTLEEEDLSNAAVEKQSSSAKSQPRTDYVSPKDATVNVKRQRLSCVLCKLCNRVISTDNLVMRTHFEKHMYGINQVIREPNRFLRPVTLLKQEEKAKAPKCKQDLERNGKKADLAKVEQTVAQEQIQKRKKMGPDEFFSKRRREEIRMERKKISSSSLAPQPKPRHPESDVLENGDKLMLIEDISEEAFGQDAVTAADNDSAPWMATLPTDVDWKRCESLVVRLTCPLCRVAFLNFAGLSLHCQRTYKPSIQSSLNLDRIKSGIKSLTCQLCRKVISSEASLVARHFHQQHKIGLLQVTSNPRRYVTRSDSDLGYYELGKSKVLYFR